MSRYGYMLPDHDDAEDGDQEPRDPPTCKQCGATGLEWMHTGVRWRLMEGTKFHTCKPSSDGFGVVKP